MGYEFKTKGIVVKESPVGDYDKRLIILTKDYGKITAFAKGCRRSQNKMMASSSLFAYSELVLYKGRNSYNVSQASLVEGFYDLRYDVELLTYGMYMLEFVEHVAKEDEEEAALLRWLLISLRALSRQKVAARLAVRIFELKAMSLLGFTPWLNECTVCQEENVAYFSSLEGGVVCHLRHEITDLLPMSKTTHYTMAYILTKPEKEAYSFTLSDEWLIELEMIMNQFILVNLNYRFKSLNFLKEL